MTGAQLIAAGERRNVNPYFLAYLLETGAKTVKEAVRRDGGTHGYVTWNEARWHEQAHAEGVPREMVSVQRGAHERHCDLLAVRLTKGIG